MRKKTCPKKNIGEIKFHINEHHLYSAKRIEMASTHGILSSMVTSMTSLKRFNADVQPTSRQLRRTMWKAIETRYCAGDSLATLVEAYSVSRDAIIKRSQLEKWPTPRRIAKAQGQAIVTDDPASLIADVWNRRGIQAREEVYQGSSTALRKFFSMSPVPTSFQEAAVVEKMLSRAIAPDGVGESKTDVRLMILTTPGFRPRPVVECIEG